MSSELHKYIETAIEKNQDLFNAEILDFPNNKKSDNSDNLKLKINDQFKTLYDRLNESCSLF